MQSFGRRLLGCAPEEFMSTSGSPRAKRLLLPSLLFATTFLVAGCQHVGHQSSARTLDAFQSRFVVATGAATWVDGDVVMLAPAVQVRMHYGISDHVEVGISGGTDGLSILSKVALIRSQSESSGFNLALEPSLGAGSYGGKVMGTLRLPLLIGYRFGGHEITLGPRVHFSGLPAHISSPGGSGRWPETGLYAGGTLGGRIKTGAHFTISPEVGWLQPLSDRGAMPIPIVNLGFSWE